MEQEPQKDILYTMATMNDEIKNGFKIPFRLPSLNEYINACRTNPHAGAKMKREWQECVCNCILIAKSRKTLKKIENPCIVHFEFYEKSQRRDIDNVEAFAHKVILDAMVQMGIMANDNRNFVVGDTNKFFKSDKDYIIVYIEEA